MMILDSGLLFWATLYNVGTNHRFTSERYLAKRTNVSFFITVIPPATNKSIVYCAIRQ